MADNYSRVRNGYATVMTVLPDVRYAGIFVGLAARARKQKKGLLKEPSSGE